MDAETLNSSTDILTQLSSNGTAWRSLCWPKGMHNTRYKTSGGLMFGSSVRAPTFDLLCYTSVVSLSLCYRSSVYLGVSSFGGFCNSSITRPNPNPQTYVAKISSSHPSPFALLCPSISTLGKRKTTRKVALDLLTFHQRILACLGSG